MSEQALDLRRALKIARRHKFLVGSVALVGLLAGAAYPVVRPAPRTSEAIVVLPLSTGQSANSSGTGAAIDNMTSTQVVIAGSDPVLEGALHKVKPSVTFQDLLNDVKTSSTTSSVITIAAQAATGDQAISIANAVADSYVAYVTSGSSPVGTVQAKVLQPATQATGPSVPGRAITYGLLGLLIAGLLGFLLALALGKSDRKLRQRDEIADSIGVPVLASYPVSHPTEPAGWTQLFNEYEPDSVHAWRMRKLLEYLGATQAPSRDRGGSSVTVLSLSSDRTALALGPQLAAYSANLGIPTTLALGVQQDMTVSAALRTACAAGQVARTRPLRVVAAQDRHFTDPRATLTVMVVVLDAADPRMPEAVPTATTLLGVSAGNATADQLARAATAAAAAGFDVAGILVADPEPTDQTTGRVPQMGRPAHRKVPTRTTNLPMEIRQ